MSTARIVSGAPIVLATGGTGGDVFPAQALAAELTARGHRVVLITDARGAAFDEASEVHRIRAATPGRSPAQLAIAARDIGLGTVAAFRLLRRLRSEEHTSELQSLMRTSYAVFCLQKKIKQTHMTT